MKHYINELIKILKGRGKEVYFWFRDDDVGNYTTELITFIDYFLKRETDILMAVIPSNVNDKTVQLIRDNERIIVAQHGFSHIDYSTDTEPKSEFPKSRNVESAVSEINMGKNMMERLFPGNYTGIFVPPFFEISDHVLQEISDWYKWYSCWWTNSVNGDRVFVNSQVDFIDWNRTKTYAGSRFIENQVLRELNLLNDSRFTSTIIGVVLHHDYCRIDSYYELDWFFYLSELHENVHIISPKKAYELIHSEGVLISEI